MTHMFHFITNSLIQFSWLGSIKAKLCELWNKVNQSFIYSAISGKVQLQSEVYIQSLSFIWGFKGFIFYV